MPAIKEFVKFIREQGVVGLAIGFILGGAVGKTVSSFVQDIIQPLLGYVLGSTTGLKAVHLGSVMVGNFLANLIDLVIIAAVVFYLFRGLKLDKLDAPKQP
jgi:large conductance mechanosensitive channel